MRYNKEIEDKLKEKGIEWDEDAYILEEQDYHANRKVLSKAELASALRDIFKIDVEYQGIKDIWKASLAHNGYFEYAKDKDADEATLLVVDKIMEGK